MSSLPVRQGFDGEEREGSDHSVCVVWIAVDHYIVALGVHQSSFWQQARFHEVPVPLIVVLLRGARLQEVNLGTQMKLRFARSFYIAKQDHVMPLRIIVQEVIYVR